MKGYKFSNPDPVAVEIDTQKKPGKSGKAQDPWDSVMKSLGKQGSGSGSRHKKYRRLSIENL